MLINKRFQHSPTETISRWIRRRTAVGKRLVPTFLEVAVDISCRSKHLRIQALRIRRRHWAVGCVPFSLISENKTFQPTLVKTRSVWILRIRCLMFRRVHGLVIELLPEEIHLIRLQKNTLWFLLDWYFLGFRRSFSPTLSITSTNYMKSP